jgi:hypothetical protein
MGETAQFWLLVFNTPMPNLDFKHGRRAMLYDANPQPGHPSTSASLELVYWRPNAELPYFSTLVSACWMTSPKT